VQFSLFYLLLLVGLLFFSLLKLALCFIIFVLLLPFFSLFLDSFAFSIAFILLGSPLFVSVVPFQKLLFSFIKPGDITDESLLKLVFNHLSVVLLFGGKLSVFGCFDLLPDFILLICNLLELLLKRHFSILDLLLLALYFINAFLDAFDHLLDLG
jgi:hypothetical protein